MSEVTVAITTTGRPAFLRTALQSVQNQIGRGSIGEVLVSENKGDRRSEVVIREFPGLPIRFLFRDPPLPMVAHLFSTFREAGTPYVAILNDDDWWSSNHVAEGIAALRSNPSATAYVSASVFVKDEAAANQVGIGRSDALWLLAGMPSWLKTWTIDAPSMLALGWLYTPFHWSTLLARTAALSEALDALEVETYPTHTVDRLVFTHLALRGNLCYNPVADSFVRWHTSNWIKDKDPKLIRAMLRSTSALIERLATERGWSVKQIWADALARMPRDVEIELLYRFYEAHTKADLRRYGLDRYFHTGLPRPRIRALRNMLVNAKNFVLGHGDGATLGYRAPK